MSGTQSALLLLFLPLLSVGANFDLSRPDPDGAGMNRERLAAIPVRMKEFVDAGKTSGVVTILARHGKLASFDAVGYQDIESKTPMQKNTMFRIASLTKPVTCAAIMILADEGRLAVIDPVEKFLPEYKGLKLNPCGARAGYNCEATAPARPINLEDLMTHTSGLPTSAQEGGGAHPGTLAELVTLGAKRQLLFEPGTHWSYSNLGINILGRIVEVVSKQSFDAFLQERIFKPLGMTDTCFWVPQEKQARLATLYTYENGGLKRAQVGQNGENKIPSPAGGLISTASDMLRFNQMMRNGGVLDGKRILSPWAVHLMTISHTGDMKAGWVPGVGHGYGYEVVRDAAGMFRYNSIGSFVKGGAYRTYEWVDPEKDMVGVIMMQLTNGGGDVADEINSFMQMAAAAIER